MKKLSPLFILAAGALWGTMGLFVRRLSAPAVGAMEIVALRVVLTAVLMALFLLIYDRRLLKIKWKDMWCFVGTGCCSIVFFNFCYFQAIMLSTLATAATLLYTAPIFVTLFSVIFFKEKITVNKIVSIALTFLGCVIVTGIIRQTGAISLPAVLVGLGAGLGYALYSIFGRFAIERGYNSLTITAYTFFTACAGVLPFVRLEKLSGVLISQPAFFIYSLFFCLVTTVVPYLLYTIGLRHVPAWRAAVFASVEPIVAALLGIFVFHEKTTLIELGGMLLVIAAMVTANAGRKRRQLPAPEDMENKKNHYTGS